ncbi:cerebellin-4-like [Mercenaria mercenaria]|uniref:cerebellin-4-like n=1 Tax=Mercenaria mercenaria TaxID=6596 RepID=UPI00234F7191|nr:cerebellin-4-like [Mercenaria mercenaria]
MLNMFQKIILSVCILSLVDASSEDEQISIKKEDLKVLMNKMKTFESVIKEQADLVRNQQDTIEELKTSVQNQKIVSAEQEAKLNLCATKADIKRHTHNGRRQSYDNTVVAFSATLNQRNVEHIGVHQNIVFSDVITNIGNGYNNHHGLFIAPVSGLYMFSTTILSGQNVEYVAAIEINGSDVVRMFERGTDNRHGSATQTVIVQLKKGDDVAVQSLSADHTYWGDRYSSFSGVLLQELETPSQIVG